MDGGQGNTRGLEIGWGEDSLLFKTINKD